MSRPVTPAAAQVLVAALFTAFRRRLSEPELALYERGLATVPPSLLDAAVALAIRSRRFLPTVSELLADAEACRQTWLVDHAWTPCETCADHGGWEAFTDDQGVARLRRCACWRAHQVLVSSHGVAAPLAPARQLESGARREEEA